MLMFLGAANRDPADGTAGRLDIARRNAGHVGFGTGIHGCVGPCWRGWRASGAGCTGAEGGVDRDRGGAETTLQQHVARLGEPAGADVAGGEEGRGSAPNPAKGRRPLEPRYKDFGREGRPRRSQAPSSPSLPKSSNYWDQRVRSDPLRVPGSARPSSPRHGKPYRYGAMVGQPVLP